MAIPACGYDCSHSMYNYCPRLDDWKRLNQVVNNYLNWTSVRSYGGGIDTQALPILEQLEARRGLYCQETAQIDYMIERVRAKAQMWTSRFDTPDPCSGQVARWKESPEMVQAKIENTERELKELKELKAKLDARPKDDYEVGSYLIAQREGSHQVYYKDAEGAYGWIYVGRSRVHWETIANLIADPLWTVYRVTHWEEETP